MSLKIYLLGQFKLQANDHSIELPSRPAQSLLAYLAVNAGVAHRREKLACLLWPESTEKNARGYLRQALWRIRKALESGFLNWRDYLDINDISVTFSGQSDYWLDANLFLDNEQRPVEAIIETVRLYRGELLPGFYEDWVVLERDRLQAAFHQKMNLLLERLIQAGRWDETLEWGEHWIRLGFAPEAAFRALMSAYAGLGDQAMVSANYQRCVEALDRELGLEPSPETTNLYKQICRRAMQESGQPSHTAPTHTGRHPPFLGKVQAHPIEKSIFVSRDRELAKLSTYLDFASGGRGHVVFITGDAGSGKTTLIHEFTRRAQEVHSDLIVAGGNCNAYTGVGDPYLPFREILELLTGDIEAGWAAGAISEDHARRLWNIFPIAVQTLVEVGPHMIGTFIPRGALLERAKTFVSGGADWLARLDNLVVNKPLGPGMHGPKQDDLFEQFTRVLKALARRAPLLLVVDDLQWADLGSISLLFHLGRQLTASTILIVGAYRPEEVAIGREGERHPLDPVANEFRREYGDIMVDLNQAESRDFVDAVLDSEPNRLTTAFREMLYRQTRGHPLFTIELLRGLQERGDLQQDSDGCWVPGPALDWETLPARVEAVIAQRLARLPQLLQTALRVASVEGDVFTAEVVARVQDADEREVVGLLSGDLDRRHGLVRVQAIERLGSHRVSRYRFRNYLFQRYLYDNLDDVERSYLHEDVGNVLEELYGDQTGEIAVKLAWHFQEAGIVERAIYYLYQAGEKALQLSAYQEGIAHLSKALTLLETLPDSPERDQSELDLQLAIGIAWVGPKGYGQEVIEAHTRARELCQKLGKIDQLCRVVGELSIVHYVWAEHQRARELAEEALCLARQVDDPLLMAVERSYLGFILFCLGEYTAALSHLEQVIAFYKPEQHHRAMVSLRGSDIGLSAMIYAACCQWCLGYPDKAAKLNREALELARALDHLYTLTDVLCFGGCLFNSMRRDFQMLSVYAEEFKQIAAGKLLGWYGQSNWQLGEALAMQGQLEEGIIQLENGLAYYRQSTTERCYLSGCLRALTEAQAKAGRLEESLNTLSEAFTVVENTNEHIWETELYRLKGEILLAESDVTGAEACFHKAIEVARRQQAKSWELRAATSLARLWQAQGKAGEARELLGDIYNWFTEGFDTPELKEARSLLEELS